MNVSESKASLLVVDDDPLIGESLGYVLARDFNVRLATSRSGAIASVQTKGSPVLALVDLGLPPEPHSPREGFALITELLAHAPEIRVIVLSGQSDEGNARHARALGAIDFVAKPVDIEHLRDLLSRLSKVDTSQSNTATAHGDKTGLLGIGPAMQRLKTQLTQFARSPFPVLIEGESGTGKELAAAALHQLSERRSSPYLAINCAAISPSLVEAALFGHDKGAFTGANITKTGYFEDALGGTLFLDEIGELPLELQPKLLRVLENGEYQRVGETRSRRSSARIIAATNRDLRTEVREGRFRADLYHRLSVFTVAMPALRELADDKWLLFKHFSALYAKQGGVDAVSLGVAARERLDGYTFPGNVRELRNIVIRLTAKHSGREIDVEQIEDELDIELPATVQPALIQGTLDGSTVDIAAVALEHLKNRTAFCLDEELRSWESAYIDAAQMLSNGNFSRAARLLGISRTTLYNRIESLTRQKRR